MSGVGDVEIKAVLSLTDWFQDKWEIVDVGANKGAWSDAFIKARDESVHAYKYGILMLEPNKKLVDYLEVKYDYNERVTVLNAAADSVGGTSEFWYWENFHNGLSSVYENPKWADLPGRKRGTVKTITLDSILSNRTVDIIKIDVEGAEFDVLSGCRNLMEQKSVSFFQVEYSEHYKVSGYTGKKVIEFANSFGYQAWEYDGGDFVKTSPEAFKEDYDLRNIILTHHNIGRYDYTENWNSEFIKNTQFLKGTVDFAMEIGCFEGRTSNYICDFLLSKEPGSRMICVDPFADFYLEKADPVTNEMFVGQYGRFMRNTKGQPIEVQRGRSQDIFPSLKDYRFSFIYIDGDHSELAVYLDGVESFKLLKKGGHILFDDYEWRAETKRGIDRFLDRFQNQIQVLIKEYQVLIRKL
jgi:FkbM family methyltransferase